MAQFYSRTLVANTTIVAPATPNTAVWYGYRSGYYILNGTQYYAANNVAVLYGWQKNNVSAYDPYSYIYYGAMDVDEVFEPSLFANPYDLAGQKYNAEYKSGIYPCYGYNVNSTNGWITWKNMVPQVTPSAWTANTTTGFPVSGVNYYGTAIGTQTPGNNQYIIVPSSTGAYLMVEGPTNTYNKFVPRTVAVHAYKANSSASWAVGTTYTEPTFGDTTVAYPCNFGVSNVPIGQYYWMSGMMPDNTLTNGNSVTSAGGYPPFEANTSSVTSTVGDQLLFGTSNTQLGYSTAYSSTGKTETVFGAALYDSGTTTSEYGARVFLARSATYSFYLHFNAVNGGIQGCDTSTGTLNRVSIRAFNHSTSTYSVLTNLKKGLSGMVIPSQSTVSTDSAYRFYWINFNGADAVSQTISIYQPTLDLTLGSSTLGAAYSLTMTGPEQAAIYTDLGHQNTAASKYDSPGFRRYTVNKVWYSTSSTGVRRLHLGIYNTNPFNYVTAVNGFNNSASRGSMFKIYSWELNDTSATATYLGSSDLSLCAPRYIHNLDSDYRTLYCGSSFQNDMVYALNNTTGLYNYQSTMPYIAPRMFKDKEGRRAVQFTDPTTSNGGIYNCYMDLLTVDVGQTIAITAAQTVFTYAGSELTSNVAVDVYNYLGNRLQKNVALSIVGPTSTPGITFSDGSYIKTIQTSNSQSTNVGIKIVSSISGKIVGTVTESI
jgi:hypothetical protein